MALFARGDQVRFIDRPDRVGLIDGEPVPYADRFIYPVFFSAGERLQVPEWQLELVPQQLDARFLPKAAFLRGLLLAKLDNPVTDLLYSFQASRTKPEAYQFKPVLKFLEAPTPGILIADEVGLGKTIEAAILYLELKARGEIDRVLIVCPAGLREKWQTELSVRFDEAFEILDRKRIKRDLDLFAERDGRQPLRAIVGLETIRAKSIQELMEESSVRYDLVIIDEAHHLRTTGTLSNQIGERLSDLADNLVLLTATPLQTDVQDLFNLLRYLDDSRFDNFEDFVGQLEPNALLNAAIRALRTVPPDAAHATALLRDIALMPQASHIVSHPSYAPVMERLGHGPLARRDVVVLQRDIERMNAISSVYTRTKKVDVTDVARRDAKVVRVDIRDDERSFYEAVLAHARAEAKAKSASGWIPGFTGMMRERQAASCMTAIANRFLERHGRPVIVEADVFDSNVERPSPDNGPTPEIALNDVLHAAQRLGQPDTKLAAFKHTIDEALANSPAHKVIVFSFFRPTLHYLNQQLVAAGYGVVTIHGGVPAGRRPGIIDRFRADPAISVMLASEVGAEGLDFQFCDTLINYDLPWNPMKVEQRIGRIDRYGQKQPQVKIYSMVLADTIEDRILTRLYERIGVFQDSIGDLEPILGDITSELTHELFTRDLTPAQEQEILEKRLLMIETRRQIETDLEEQRSQVLGNDALMIQVIDDGITSGRYVSSAELKAVIAPIVVDTHAHVRDDLADGTSVLHPSADLARLIRNHASDSGDGRPETQAFIGRLMGSTPIPMTFDGARALERPLLELITPRHALVRAGVDMARSASRGDPMPIVNLLVAPGVAHEHELPDGEFSFGLFLAEISGAMRATRLLGVVVDSVGQRVPTIEDILLRIVQDGSEDAHTQAWTRAQQEQALAQAMAFAAGDAERAADDARTRNEGVVSLQAASLKRTYGAKIARRRRLHAEARNELILRLRAGEIRNLEAELNRRLDELERGRTVGFTLREIGAGRLEVRA